MVAGGYPVGATQPGEPGRKIALPRESLPLVPGAFRESPRACVIIFDRFGFAVGPGWSVQPEFRQGGTTFRKLAFQGGGIVRHRSVNRPLGDGGLKGLRGFGELVEIGAGLGDACR